MNPHATASMDELSGWFPGRIPADWFAGTPEVLSDRDEILGVGTLSDPELPSDATAEVAASARVARIAGVREGTREHRVRMAQEAQHRFGRRVSWGASCGDVRKLFTTVSVPAMTRLRPDERRVLATLVAGGVARSRSHALAWCVRLVAQKQDEWLPGLARAPAWCVRLVAQKQDEWLEDLRDALSDVEKVRGEGPTS